LASIAASSQELKQLLGESRAALLAVQAKDYFDQYGDKLGVVQLEFVNDHGRLVVYSRNRWGEFQYYQTVTLPVASNQMYGHLFGPGAPCELK